MRRLVQILALGCWLLALGACGDLRVIPEHGQAQQEEVPVELTTLTLNSYDAGPGPAQIVHAAHGQLYQEDHSATLEDFTLQFLQHGQLQSEVTADWGRVDMDTSTFVAFARGQRIKIRSFEQNAILYVTQWAYDPETRQMSTALPAGVESPGGTDEEYTLIQAAPDGSALISQGRGISADLQLNYTASHPSVTTVPTFDLEAFDREFRPIHREDTPAS